MSDASDAVKNRMRYRNKSIWICYLCAVCEKCYKNIDEHPTEHCRDFSPRGGEVTFDLGKEWFLKDMHLLRYHQKDMLAKISKKYLKPSPMGIQP